MALALQPPLSSRNGAVRGSRPGPPVACQVRHAMPGRLRMRLPGLRLRPEIWARLEHNLLVNRGVEAVELRPRDEHLMVRFDPKVYPGEKARAMVERELQLVTTRPLPDDEYHRAADIEREKPGKINPLLMPTVACALAGLEAAPPLLAGAAIAAAAYPVFRRGFHAMRRGCLATEQLDLLSIGLTAANGNMPMSAVISWLIALSDMIRRDTRRQVRQSLTEWQLAAGRKEPASVALETAPLTNSQTEAELLQQSGRLKTPTFGAAAVDFALTRDPSRLVGILKPVCELESTSQAILPAAMLSAMTEAARRGILFSSAAALERLATVERVALSRSSGAVRIATELERRGIEVVTASPDLRADECAAIILAARARGNDCSCLRIRTAGAVEDADVTLAADLALLPLAVDLAREGSAAAKSVSRTMSLAFAANLGATLLGLSPAPLSTLINSGATVAASMTAIRPPVPPTRPDIRPAAGRDGAGGRQ